MNKAWTWLKGAAKAVVAFATPVVSGLAGEWLTDLETALPGLVAGALTAIVTYRVPNQPPSTPVP